MVEVQGGTSVVPVRAGAWEVAGLPAHGSARVPAQRSARRPPAPSRGEPRAISVRRLARWALVIGAFLVAALALWQDPGYAHNGTLLRMS
jgi:hypothetical protein